MSMTKPNVATNVQDVSRLLTLVVLTDKAKAIVDLVLRYPDAAPEQNWTKNTAHLI
jgi:hypothetical protein